ncbi:hypothetical protein ABEY43_06925 [Priestia megaterium]
MLKEDQKAYHVNRKDGEMIEGTILKRFYKDDKELIAIKINHDFYPDPVNIEVAEAGSSKEEAIAKYEQYKDNLKEELLLNDEWVEWLMSGWLENERHKLRTEEIVIKEIIKERLNKNI